MEPISIQWKGVDVCLDLNCTCGEYCHYDRYFAYNVQCPYCGIIWKLNVSAEPLVSEPVGCVVNPTKETES